MPSRETTDLTLFVRSSKEDITEWNRQRIVDALMRETSVDLATADEISREVERQIKLSGMDILTAPLVRELVNAKLMERGLEKATKMHARLGFPLYDVEELILYRNRENANIPHSPEGTNLTLAEGIKKEYALLRVFSDEVGLAHARGDMHIHNLGYIDRLYCCCQSLEYIKKYGLALPSSLAVASPAKHPETLLAHMVRFAAALQGVFAGAIGWDGVNVLFAPYLAGRTDDEVCQLAQMMIYEFAQQAVGRGGQTIFTDIHIYWDVPRHLRDAPALGPGGVMTGGTYGDWAGEARRFAVALFRIFLKGDAGGRPFVFPRPFIHLSEGCFRGPDFEDFLHLICNVAIERGNTHFIFDRDGSYLSECGRYSFGDDDAGCLYDPVNIRLAAVQNVSLNLPRAGLRAGGDEKSIRDHLEVMAALAIRAHVEKRRFIERLLALGSEGPLGLLAMKREGAPYLLMEEARYLLGFVGLNELAKISTGAELHESAAAREFGVRVVSFLKERAEAMGKKEGIRVMLQQTPAETTAYRFARLDLKHFSPRSGHIVKGNIARGEVYYTNSTRLAASSPTAPFERALHEGVCHPLIGGDAITYLWLDESRPPSTSLASFITRVFRETENKHVIVSPEFTTCLDCHHVGRGITDRCGNCGSGNVDGIARITGYYSRVSGWNRGKLAELRERKRERAFDE